MSYAGDDRGERDYKVQERAALHSEREHAV